MDSPMDLDPLRSPGRKQKNRSARQQEGQNNQSNFGQQNQNQSTNKRSQRRQSQDQQGQYQKGQQQQNQNQKGQQKQVQHQQKQQQQSQNQQDRSQQGQSRRDSASNTERAVQKNINNDKQTYSHPQRASEPEHSSVMYCPVLYCPGCNEVGHNVFSCKAEKHKYSICSALRCKLCEERGHTKDECNNPWIKKCRICCRPGHSAMDCRFRGWGRTLHAPAGSRMTFNKPVWHVDPGKGHQMPQCDSQGDVIMTDTAVLAFPTTNPSQPYQLLNRADTEHIRNAFIQKHIDRSRTLYPKQCVDTHFAKFENEMLAMMPSKTLWAVRGRLNMGYHFFRDPEAMAALALRLRPRCLTCWKFGEILDYKMCGIPEDVDVLSVQDEAHWGLVVHTACSCCIGGFRYEPKCIAA